MLTSEGTTGKPSAPLSIYPTTPAGYSAKRDKRISPPLFPNVDCGSQRNHEIQATFSKDYKTNIDFLSIIFTEI